MSRAPGRPRIIRRVSKVGQDKRPKVARDRRTMIQMERIRAQTEKPCTYYACKLGRVIAVGVEFARVTSPLHTKRIGHRYVPDPKDFHFECVPPEARPLVRFFVAAPP